MSKHNKGKAKGKPNKPNTTQIRTIKPGESKDAVKLVDNDTGKLVPTKEDKALLAKAKESQRLYRQKKLEAQELLRKAKEDMIALNGSQAIKILKQELEDKIKAKLAEVTKAREAFKALVSEYNSLTEEYKELTGISTKAIKANGKTKTRITGDGDWDPVIKAIDKDSVKILVNHKPTSTVFEDTLFADDNGLISHKHWLELRERFYQHSGDNPDKPKSVFYDLYQSLDNGAKANFRAFLYPRLYNLISKVKAIADKID